MSTFETLLEDGRLVTAADGWRRTLVDADGWRRAVEHLARGRLALSGLWGSGTAVHMALVDDSCPGIGVVSLDCPDGTFPSAGRWHAPAIRLERSIRDLWGLEAEGALDVRPWLDHGRWGLRQPLAGRATPGRPLPGGGAAPINGNRYDFLPAEGESLHRIPVGPVHAGIIEPGHFRFTANGETVVRLEARLGYTHKGVEGLMAGLEPAAAARLAGRVSGDSTVAYALAYARAVEAALGIAAPPRAAWLRALMAELERLANHLGDIGAICNDAAFSLMHAHCGVLREQVLRAADSAFGHRLMMDRIVPGGLHRDLAGGDEAPIRALVATVGDRFPALVELYENTASLQDRTVGTGVVDEALCRRFAAGGYVGRASGRGFDVRRAPGYPPYDELEFDVPVRTEGDVDARVWIRIEEVRQSLALVEQILDRLPAGPVFSPPSDTSPVVREGMGWVEGFRGDILAWVAIGDGGRIAACHLRDPSWFQWPLLEAAIEGNIVADFPLCNKSFNCSYSGQDL